MQIPLGPASSVGFRDGGQEHGAAETARGPPMKRLDAANDHDTGKQIARTRQIWQPRIGRNLTDEDARQINENITGFFGVLAEWARTEKMATAPNDNASPKEGEVRRDR
jgi:hypothetical protein